MKFYKVYDPSSTFEDPHMELCKRNIRDIPAAQMKFLRSVKGLTRNTIRTINIS